MTTKTEVRHTPGPWEYNDNDDGNFHIEGQLKRYVSSVDYIINPTDKQITQGWFTHPEAEANARLIAAAPELLEALQKIAGLPEPMDNDHGPLAFNVRIAKNLAEAAIAKAVGL